MKKIYLWGAGFWADYVYQKINRRDFEILGMIDSDINRQNTEWKDGIIIYTPQRLILDFFDYLLITPQKYGGIRKQCLEMQIPEEKILVYWRDEEYQGVIENRSYYIDVLEKENQKYLRRLENAPFEYGMEQIPVIKSSVELLKYILNANASLSRFGDGEFELMSERPRPWFQKVDKQLADRLKEIIHADVKENIVIAIADDFGCLEKYTEKAADGIRAYMTKHTRADIMKFIDLKREYYDAYVTRPYMIYKNKKNAAEIFSLFKKIWRNRNVILVEGKYARIGAENDLFADALSVRRILCPQKNAWNRYEEILQCVKMAIKSGDLVCVSLGPTATIMAYDLSQMGFQTLDIGQLDNEYEWCMRSAEERIAVPYKMTAEVNNSGIDDLPVYSEYYAQIIGEIV